MKIQIDGSVTSDASPLHFAQPVGYRLNSFQYTTNTSANAPMRGLSEPHEKLVLSGIGEISRDPREAFFQGAGWARCGKIRDTK